LPKTFTADSVVVKRLTKTFSADALLLATFTKTFTADAWVFKPIDRYQITLRLKKTDITLHIS